MRPFAAAVILACIPSVALALAEQPLVLRVDPFDGPVRPQAAAATTSVGVEVPCRSLEGRAVEVRLSLGATPAWLTAEISPGAVRVGPCAPGRESVSGRATLSAETTMDAAAYRSAVVNVTARADGFTEARASAQVIPGFVGAIAAEAAEAEKTAADGSPLFFAVKVTNLGNGAQRVTVDVVSAPEGFVVRPPGQFVVGARQEGDPNEREVEVGVVPPDRTADGAIALRLSSAFVRDPGQLGDEATVHLLVRARSTPGAAVGVVLVGIATGALAIARRSPQR